MASEFFESLIEKELQQSGRDSIETEYTYSVILASNRPDMTGTAVTFAFKQPVSISEAKSDSIANSVLGILDTNNLNMVDAILGKLKLTKNIQQPTKKQGKGRFFIGRTSEYQEGDLKAGIQLANGRFVSGTNLRALLKVLTIRNIMKEMTSATTSGLKYRTGRFASSIDVFPVSINKATPTKLSLYYTYMLYPYATFDPAVSRQPWLLKGGARNPQKLIGESLLKAAKEIIHARYSFDVKQGR